MVQLRVKLQDFDKLESNISGAKTIALAASLRWLVDSAKQTSPKATGKYANAFRYRTYKRITGTSGDVYNTMDYALYADKGRKSGKMPPYQPIADLLKLKGIPESAIYPIRKKIEREGTEQYKKQESYMGIDYQGNIIRGGLVHQAELKFQRLIEDIRFI